MMSEETLHMADMDRDELRSKSDEDNTTSSEGRKVSYNKMDDNEEDDDFEEDEDNSSSTNPDDWKKELKDDAKEGTTNRGYITLEDDQGQLQRVKMEMDEMEGEGASKYLDVLRTSIFDMGIIGRRRSSVFMGRTQTKDEEQGDNESVELKPDVRKKLAKESRRRIIGKNGQYNVYIKNALRKRKAFIMDIFTTAIDAQWRYTILSFMASFFVTWIIFAGLYYVVAWAHGDLEPDNLPGGVNQVSGEFTPCIYAIHDIVSCYLFSMETQHTIGYGSRQTSEACWSAILLVSLQSVLGVLFSSCMAGIVFAKLSKPKNRTHTVVFSKNAVVSMVNGALTLIFRIGNIRRSHLIECHVRAQVIFPRRRTEEGQQVFCVQHELKVSTIFDSDSEDRALLFLPVTVSHHIDEESPFYSMTPRQMLMTKFEIVATLEGIVEPTGNSFQARTSFLPREILWGYHFENMVSYGSKSHSYVVDCSYLNEVLPDETPRMSQKELDKKAEESERTDTAATLTED